MMIILKHLFTKTRKLLTRDPTIPAVCYDPCNNAYLSAQKIGKTPALCAANSTFRSYAVTCENCVGESIKSDTSLSTLEQFVEYCDSIDPIPGLNSTASINITSYSIVPTVAPFTTTIGGVVTTWSFTTNVTQYPQVPNTAIVQIPQTVNGQLTTWTFTTTYSNLPSNAAFVSNDSSTPSPTHISSVVPSGNRAWIAGPIVGCVVGVSLIFIGGFFLWRHRRNGRKPSTELEARGIPEPKSELEAPNRPQELDVDSTRIKDRGEVHELPGLGLII
ncbi:hypothetical protein F5B19DRAFT_478159 [Rostrohypoxylon terebratum]|nr:hypothetical protein F5B19DRAFT_478159 [Rostrohypoxylon terebratum]